MLEHNGNMDKGKMDHPSIEKRIEMNNVESRERSQKIDDNDKINEENDIRSIVDTLTRYPTYYDDISKLNHDEVRQKLKATLGKHFEDFPSLIQDTLIFMNFPGDNGRSIATKPDWYDMEKFTKGQAFARDNTIGLLNSQLYGLICLLCHQDGLTTLTMTKKSYTPYLAFNRYMSTTERIRNWYREDPWKDGSNAYKDIRIVRRLHGIARKKLCELDHDEIKEMGTLKNPYCPAFSAMRKDFRTSLCPDTMENFIYTQLIDSPYRPKGINQVEMSYTLFGFMGFVVLFPREMGIYAKSDEDLENFCHVWRTIGYLLGVEDEVNFCRGSLEDVKQRGREYLEFLVKPAFLNIAPQWEHMLRCILVGFGYFLPSISFRATVLNLADLMNIEMPELYASLSYVDWFQYKFSKFFIRWGLKFTIIRYHVNKLLDYALDKAINASKTKRTDLEEKSRISKLHVDE